MLRPDKHPLIDQALVATDACSLRRSRWIIRFVVFATVLLCSVFLWNLFTPDETRNSDVWWRTLVTSLIKNQFNDSIDKAKFNQLSEQVKTLQTERNDLQTRLQTLDKLVQSAKINVWLRQFSVTRESDNEISYEILLANPNPGAQTADAISKPSGNNMVVTVRGIDKFDSLAPEAGLAQSISRFKTVSHELIAPQVAETLRGKLNSKAAKFLIATVIPFDNSALTEVKIIPVSDLSRSQ